MIRTTRGVPGRIRVPALAAGRALRAALTIAVLALAALPDAARAQKVFIAVDLEGIAGLVSGSQMGSGGADYGLGRSLAEAETNAAIEAAFRAGATAVHVIDSHGSKTNLRPDRLDPRALLLTGQPRLYGMLHGVDSTYDAIVFIGFHARAGTAEAIADHTYTGAIKDIRLNGRALGEAGLAGALAGHYGVPVVFLSGDSAAVAEAREDFPGLETASVKTAVSHGAAWAIHPERARAMIASGVEAGVRRRDDIRPMRLETPVTIDIEVEGTAGADQILFIPGMRRTGARTVRYVAPDVPTAYRVTRLVRLLAAG